MKTSLENLENVIDFKTCLVVTDHIIDEMIRNNPNEKHLARSDWWYIINDGYDVVIEDCGDVVFIPKTYSGANLI